MNGLLTWCETAFWWVLGSTLEATVIIALIVGVQALLRDRLPARWQYGLWLVLLARMVIPVAPPASFSVFNLVNGGLWSVQRASGVEVIYLAGPSLGLETSYGAGLPAVADTALLGEIATPQAIEAIPPWVAGWVLGVMLLAGYIALVNVMFASRMRQVQKLRPASERDTHLVDPQALLDECARDMGVRRQVAVCETTLVDSPALYGLFRPRILLPPGMLATLDSDALRHVFLHELAHVKRWDIAVNWIVIGLQALHWFNPVVWYAFHRLRVDRELACDDLALRHAGPGESRAYGHTLVGLAETWGRTRYVASLAGIAEGRSNLKRRIRRIARFQYDARTWSVLALAVATALTLVSLTDAAEKPPATEEESPAAVEQNPTTQAESLRESAERLVRKAPYMKAISLLDQARWIDSDVFQEVSERIIELKVEAGIPLTLSEQKFANPADEAQTVDEAFPIDGAQLLRVREVLSAAPAPLVPGSEESVQGDHLQTVRGEVQRMLNQFDFVRKSWVIIAEMPKPLIVGDRRRLQAAVTLDTTGNLTRKQIKAVVDLVSSASGEDLSPQGITVTSSDGTVLHAPKEKIGDRRSDSEATVQRARESAVVYENGIEKESAEPGTPAVEAKTTASPELQRALEREISPRFIDVPLSEVVRAVGRLSDIRIVIDSRAVAEPGTGEDMESASEVDPRYGKKSDGMINYIDFEQVPVADVLKAITKPLGLAYRLEEDFIFVSKPEILAPTVDEIRRDRIRERLEDAGRYLEYRFYDVAAKIYQDVLNLDPENREATDGLHEAALGASGEPIRDFERNKQIERKMTREYIEKAKTLPEGTDATGIKPYRLTIPPIEEEYEAPVRLSPIEEKLQAIVGIEFDDTHLDEIVAFIRKSWGINIVIDARVVAKKRTDAEDEAAPEADPFYGEKSDGMIDYINLQDVTLAEALNAITRMLGLAWSVEPSFIYITKPEVLRWETFETLERRLYRVRRGPETAGMDLAAIVVERVNTLVPGVYDVSSDTLLSSAEYDEDSGILTLRNAPSRLDAFEEHLSVIDGDPHPELNLLRQADSLEQRDAGTNGLLEIETHTVDINGDGIAEKIPFYRRPNASAGMRLEHYPYFADIDAYRFVDLQHDFVMAIQESLNKQVGGDVTTFYSPSSNTLFVAGPEGFERTIHSQIRENRPSAYYQGKGKKASIVTYTPAHRRDPYERFTVPTEAFIMGNVSAFKPSPERHIFFSTDPDYRDGIAVGFFSGKMPRAKPLPIELAEGHLRYTYRAVVDCRSGGLAEEVGQHQGALEAYLRGFHEELKSSENFSKEQVMEMRSNTEKGLQNLLKQLRGKRFWRRDAVRLTYRSTLRLAS